MTIWRAIDRVWEFPRPPLIMGIVNVTPDSFSDGGKHATTASAVKHALYLENSGADILDIGGESTRPGAEPVTQEEELNRVIPVIEKLAGKTKIAISIDTQKPAVAKAALKAGASIINDIAANREDEAMWQLVAETKSGYVAMHMLGDPKTMQRNPKYADVLNDVEAFFNRQMKRWTDWGISLEQVVLDPGIGFGKTLEHNLALMKGLERLTRMERPLAMGTSRKSFIGELTGAGVNDRLPGSLASACRATQAGAAIIRTHDVEETTQALRVWTATN
ncbi:MAG: dihydropteroate synthase [Verrucomicrobiota bacterium]|nr:dihydropteroate synthase [Verrucomicrobiota bacterium]